MIDGLFIGLLQLLENFVEEYFDHNPISQLGIITTKNGRATKVSELAGKHSVNYDDKWNFMFHNALAILFGYVWYKHIQHYIQVTNIPSRSIDPYLNICTSLLSRWPLIPKTVGWLFHILFIFSSKLFSGIWTKIWMTIYFGQRSSYTGSWRCSPKKPFLMYSMCELAYFTLLPQLASIWNVDG